MHCPENQNGGAKKTNSFPARGITKTKPIGRKAGINVRVAEEAYRLHQLAFGDNPVLRDALDAGGEYMYRVRGEEHMWTPDSIAKLQHAARANNHATDYGPAGMAETRAILIDSGLLPAGSGHDLSEARAPVFVGSGARKVAVVAVAISSSPE